MVRGRNCASWASCACASCACCARPGGPGCKAGGREGGSAGVSSGMLGTASMCGLPVQAASLGSVALQRHAAFRCDDALRCIIFGSSPESGREWRRPHLARLLGLLRCLLRCLQMRRQCRQRGSRLRVRQASATRAVLLLSLLLQALLRRTHGLQLLLQRQQLLQCSCRRRGVEASRALCLLLLCLHLLRLFRLLRLLLQLLTQSLQHRQGGPCSLQEGMHPWHGRHGK